MSKFIITGMGRSGTGYVSAVLRALGINAGHESIWNFGYPEIAADWGDLDGEVGWIAGAHLENFDGPVVHVTRYPPDVINSRFTTGWYEHPFYRQIYDFVNKRIDLTRYERPIDQAMHHYLAWCELIDTHADLIVQLEKFGEALPGLLNTIGHPRPAQQVELAVRAVPTNRNQHVHHKLVDWAFLEQHTRAPELLDRLKQKAGDYGY